ncbi:unnamed protein product [Amoebophrya sp. A25]|nr:unnamed protein product [Amoebophrya sp. A25]|eukprot:GSA25T00000264001.1
MATSDKYDRQVRLWGTSGQAEVAKGHVLCLGGSAVLSEAAKNVILPGVGKVTIVDDQKVTAVDLRTNFFVVEKQQQDTSILGTSRAEAVRESLQTLNPDSSVVGVDVGKNGGTTSDWLESEASRVYLSKADASLILVDEQHVPIEKVRRALERLSSPPVVVRCLSRGFVGWVRLEQVASTTSGSASTASSSSGSRPHIVMDSKPEGQAFVRHQLRLSKPFGALQKYAFEGAFSDVEFAGVKDSAEHAHIPYPIILLHARKLYSEGQGGSSLRTREEKEAFKKCILRLRRSPDEQNFQEALDVAYLMYDTPASSAVVPEDTREALEALAVERRNGTKDDADLRLAAQAVMKFCEEKGALPLPGSLPDMTSTTEGYIALQELYRRQAEAEIDEIAKAEQTTISPSDNNSNSSSENLKTNVGNLCRSAFALRCVDLRQETTPALVGRGTTTTSSADQAHRQDLAEDCVPMEVETSTTTMSKITRLLPEELRAELECMESQEEVDESMLPWFLGIAKVVEEEQQLSCGRGTATGGGQGAPQIKDEELSPVVLEAIRKATMEVRRCPGQVHPTSALIGGIAAQEAIKLITRTYVPLDNTLVYSGVVDRSEVFKI